ncbi:hypothetical protein ACFVH7_18230, partial [Kitasatospora indigofera]|uniref:hypothetical protein n=1 Tax=Kitasatospora indigofera TaxID=67307 RepID=UPI003639DF44
MIAPSLVLTSAHVAPDVGGTVSVYRPGQAGAYAARTVWRGSPGGVDDAALLLVDDTAWEPVAGAGVRWGRLVTTRPGTACETWGIPDLVQREGRATDTLHPAGTLNPGDRDVGNRYVMNITTHPPDAREDGGSPWGGISGSALFCGDLLTGVIASDPAGRAHAALEAVPAYVLLNAPAFRTALAEHAPRAGTVLEAAEWQHLAENPEPPAGRAGSPAALLRARRQAVPFRGRSGLIDTLTAWCRQPGFGAHLVHGPGGQGKTRLADHLAGLLAAEKYAVLWLRANTSGEDLEVLAGAAKPLLVVVDYAETRTPQLLALLEAAARHPGSTAFKVLLLARTPGDWWTALQAATPAAEDLLDGSGDTLLDPLEPAAGASRTQAYHEALDGYADHLSRLPAWQNHDWPAITSRLQTRELEAGTLAGALTLHMTALADLLDAATAAAAAAAEDPAGSGTPTPTGAHGVEDRLLKHELRYWTTTAAAHCLTPTLTLATLTDALAAAFLLGADDRAQAEALLQLVPGLADQSHDRRNAVRGWITALYPPTTGGQAWDSLQPDRLTERFIGRTLDADPALAHHLLDGARPDQAAQLLTVYGRAAAHPVFQQRLDTHLTALCVRHHHQLAAQIITTATRTDHSTPFTTAIDTITANPATTLSDLATLYNQLPRSSQRLARTALQLARTLTERYRKLAEANPQRHLPDLATALNNVSVQLGEVGQEEAGLAAIREAVDIRRTLAQANPDTHLPNLATALNNLAVQLGQVGQEEAGLAAIREAVDIHRTLAQANPDTHLPDLAMALNNLAIQLGKTGQGEAGLAAIREAVDIHRTLAQANPDTHLPNLATALNNLAIHLGVAGQGEAGLAASREAVDIHRTLAQANPDTHLPNLAGSLSNLSIQRGEVGLAASREAVDIHRALAQANPQRYLPDLASSLNNLSIRLGEADQGEAGLAAVQEAAGYYRALAQANPDAHLPNLATTLNSLAVRLGEKGQGKAGLAASREAVDIHRALAQANPQRYLPDLASSLNNLAIRLGEADQGEAGLAAVQEAAGYYRALAQANPDAHLPY